jgi:pyrimidine operon attenuation protein/uracil phosphoribosyltransferase
MSVEVRREKALVMTSEEIRRSLVRISHEILERDHQDLNNLVLIGIRRGGDHLAHRIAVVLETVENRKIPVGIIDTSLYRDDLNLHHTQVKASQTDIPFEVTGKQVVLVDDVLYTGRTVRAAMEAVIDFGRPSAIQLAVLIDRGHRELPISADYVGKNIPTSRKETVQVDLSEEDKEDRAVIYEGILS